MGIFSKKPNLVNADWNILESERQLDEIIQLSNKKTQVIFKHSVTCGISAGAKYRLEDNWDLGNEVDFYYLDLLSNRAVSNAVSEKLNIIHQSPQVIVVKNGIASDKVSHHAINLSWLKERI